MDIISLFGGTETQNGAFKNCVLLGSRDVHHPSAAAPELSHIPYQQEKLQEGKSSFSHVNTDAMQNSSSSLKPNDF